MTECKHDKKIKILRQKHGYVWSCAECGQQMALWNQIVWDTIMQGWDGLEIGEGFTFNIVEREE